jgi:ribonuclease P protein component
LHRVALDLAVVLPPHKPLFGHRDVWVGAMVPKRWAKRAVMRNTIKRQIFALSRDYESVLQAAAYVIRLRAAFDKTAFVSATSDVLKAAVRSELQQLFSLASSSLPSKGLAQ